jgi:hypothetical protein
VDAERRCSKYRCIFTRSSGCRYGPNIDTELRGEMWTNAIGESEANKRCIEELCVPNKQQTLVTHAVSFSFLELSTCCGFAQSSI